MKKDIEKTTKDWEKFSKKLNNKKFIQNAPDKVVEEVREKEKYFSEKLEALKHRLSEFM